MTETTLDMLKSVFLADGFKIEGPKADGSYTCHLYIGEKGREGMAEMIKWPRTGAYQVAIIPIKSKDNIFGLGNDIWQKPEEPIQS